MSAGPLRRWWGGGCGAGDVLLSLLLVLLPGIAPRVALVFLEGAMTRCVLLLPCAWDLWCGGLGGMSGGQEAIYPGQT